MPARAWFCVGIVMSLAGVLACLVCKLDSSLRGSWSCAGGWCVADAGADKNVLGVLASARSHGAQNKPMYVPQCTQSCRFTYG